MTKVVFSNSRRANWPQVCDSLTQLWPSCFSSTSDHRVRNVKMKHRTSCIQQLTSSHVRLYACMIWHLFKEVYPDQWARDPDLLCSGVTLGSLGLYLVKTCVCLLSLTASIYSVISWSLFSTRFLSHLLWLLLSLHGVTIRPTLIGIWWVLFPLCLFSALVNVSRYFFINVQNDVYIIVLLISFYLSQWL